MANLRQLVARKIQTITDKELFTSVTAHDFCSHIIEGITKTYNRAIKVKIVWEENMTACCQMAQDKYTLTINANSPFAKDKSREDKFRILKGLLLHEIGHILFTPFSLAIQCTKEINMSGNLYPIPTNVRYAEYTDYVAQVSKAKLSSLWDSFDNTIEDGFIERLLVALYRGYGKSLAFLREIHYSTMLSYEQMQAQNMEEWAVALNLLLCYAKYDKVKCDMDSSKSPAITFLLEHMGQIDDILNQRNSYVRQQLKNDLFVDYVLLIKQIEEEKNNSNQQGADGQNGGQQGTDGQNGNQQGTDGQNGSQQGTDGQNGGQQGTDGQNGGQQGTDGQNGSQQGTDGQNGGQQGTDGQNGGQQGTDGQNGSQQGTDGQNGGQQGTDGQNGGQQGTDGQNGNQQGADGQNGNQQGADGQNGNQQGADGQNGSQQGTDGQNGGQQGASSPLSDDILNELAKNISDAVKNDGADFSSMGQSQSIDVAPTNSGNSSGSSPNSSSKTPYFENNGDEDVENAVNQLVGDTAKELACNEEEENLRQREQIEMQKVPYGNFHTGTSSTFIRNKPNSNHIESYEKTKPTLLPVSRKLQANLKKELKDLRDGDTMNGLYMGQQLDTNALYRYDKRIMKRNIAPVDVPDMAVCLLVDESGSMQGKNIECARNTAYILYDFCKALNIPIAIYGHTASSNHVSIYSYAEFNSVDGLDKYRIMGMQARNCNRDGYALRYAVNRLEKQSADVKLMIVISDGSPHDSYYGYSEGKADIQHLLKEKAKKDIKFITAGLGSDMPIIKNIYTEGLSEKVSAKFIATDDLDKLPKTLVRIIKKYVKG